MQKLTKGPDILVSAQKDRRCLLAVWPHLQTHLHMSRLPKQSMGANLLVVVEAYLKNKEGWPDPGVEMSLETVQADFGNRQNSRDAGRLFSIEEE